MPNTAMKDDGVDRKIINVSKRRQITIPLEFYKKLGLKKEVECTLKDDIASGKKNGAKFDDIFGSEN